jgi:hypothetical protein
MPTGIQQIDGTTGDYTKSGFPGVVNAPNGYFYAAIGGFSSSLGYYVINIWRSLDGSTGTWSVVDAAHSIMDVGSSIATPLAYAMTIKGDTLYVVNTPDGAFEQVSSFDTVTGLWTGTTVTTNDATNDRTVCIHFRDLDSELVIGGSPGSLAIGGNTRTGYFLFDSVALTYGAWVANGETGASAVDWENVGILQGPGDELEFFFWSKPLFETAGEKAIYLQALSSSNTLGSVDTIDSLTDGGDPVTTPSCYSDGINCSIVWVRSTTELLIARVFTAPVSTLSFTLTILTITGSTGIINVAVANSVTTGVVVFFAIAASGVVYEYTTDTGGGFGAFVNLGAAGTTNFFWANIVGTSLGLLLIAENIVEFWTPLVRPAAGGKFLPRFVKYSS